MRATCCVTSATLNPNLTDIEEDFLQEIDASENLVSNFTTLQPKSLLITQRREQQFSEVSTPEIIMLQQQLNISNLGAQVDNQSVVSQRILRLKLKEKRWFRLKE